MDYASLIAALTPAVDAAGSVIQDIKNLGFVLEATPLLNEKSKIESPIANKKVMFTGKMLQGNRSTMQEQARELGATVLTSVSGKLQILVIGEDASQSKINKATKANVSILKEDQYIELINSVSAVSKGF